MGDEEKLLWLFKQLHGDIDADRSSCYLEVSYPDEFSGEIGEPTVNVMKDGNLCWSKTRSELTFEYITKHLD